MMLRRANPGIMMLAPNGTQVPVAVVDNLYPVPHDEQILPVTSQRRQFDGHATQAFEAVVYPVDDLHCKQWTELAKY